MGRAPGWKKGMGGRQWKDQAVWSGVGILNARTEAPRFGRSWGGCAVGREGAGRSEGG